MIEFGVTEVEKVGEMEVEEMMEVKEMMKVEEMMKVKAYDVEVEKMALEETKVEEVGGYGGGGVYGGGGSGNDILKPGSLSGCLTFLSSCTV